MYYAQFRSPKDNTWKNTQSGDQGEDLFDVYNRLTNRVSGERVNQKYYYRIVDSNRTPVWETRPYTEGWQPLNMNTTRLRLARRYRNRSPVR